MRGEIISFKNKVLNNKIYLSSFNVFHGGFKYFLHTKGKTSFFGQTDVQKLFMDNFLCQCIKKR